MHHKIHKKIVLIGYCQKQQNIFFSHHYVDYNLKWKPLRDIDSDPKRSRLDRESKWTHLSIRFQGNRIPKESRTFRVGINVHLSPTCLWQHGPFQKLLYSSHCLSIAKKKKKTNVHIRQTLLIICSQYRKCWIHSYTHSLSSCYVVEKHSFSGLCMFKFNQNVQKSSSGSRWKGMMLS